MRREVRALQSFVSAWITDLLDDDDVAVKFQNPDPQSYMRTNKKGTAGAENPQEALTQ